MEEYRIWGVNYADERFRKAQKLNSETMYKLGKVDKVLSFTRDDLDERFMEEYSGIINQKRGGGYWCWKPYVIGKALEQMNEGDYLFYCDSGAVVLQPVKTLVDALIASGQNAMPFSLTVTEKKWTKRDAFILLECDSEEYTESCQRVGGFVVLKKCAETVALIKEYEEYAKDERIITDKPSCLGMPDYDGFTEHRHDQSLWSLLTKKHGYKAFADPSLDLKIRKKVYNPEILAMSTYGKVIDSTRNGNIETLRQYKWLLFRKKFSPWLRFARTPFGRKVKHKLKKITHRLRGIE